MNNSTLGKEFTEHRSKKIIKEKIDDLNLIVIKSSSLV
jgi:hypothetical protein